MPANAIILENNELHLLSKARYRCYMYYSHISFLTSDGGTKEGMYIWSGIKDYRKVVNIIKHYGLEDPEPQVLRAVSK